MSELILKERISKFINELITSIELRIKLNEAIVDMQGITTLDSASKLCSPEIEEDNDLMTENVNQVVCECQETLEKLALLKKHFAEIDGPKLLYLFNNYSQLSLEEFKVELYDSLALVD